MAVEWQEVGKKPWVLAGIAVLVVVAFVLYLRRGSQAVTYVPSAPEEHAGGGAGGTGGGGALMPDLSAISQQLEEQRAGLEALAGAIEAQTAALPYLIQPGTSTEEIRRVIREEMPPARSEQVVVSESRAAAAYQPETVKWWYGGEVVGQKTVQPQSLAEKQILEAKQAYWRAQELGDKAAMERAHQEAEAIRQEAAKRGEPLAGWALSSGR